MLAACCEELQWSAGALRSPQEHLVEGWIFQFLLYFHFSWTLPLYREAVMRKRTHPSSSMDLSRMWHLGLHKGLILRRAVDQPNLLQLNWLQGEEETFYHLLRLHSSMPSSSLEARPYLLTTFSTGGGRAVTRGAIKGNIDMQEPSDCWKIWLWLPTKTTSLLKGLLSREVLSHHINFGPSKVVSAKATAEVSFLFGGAELQLVQEPLGTVLSLGW